MWKNKKNKCWKTKPVEQRSPKTTEKQKIYSSNDRFQVRFQFSISSTPVPSTQAPNKKCDSISRFQVSRRVDINICSYLSEFCFCFFFFQFSLSIPFFMDLYFTVQYSNITISLNRCAAPRNPTIQNAIILINIPNDQYWIYFFFVLICFYI